MKYHIITYGCQMNKSDSERIAAFLENKGYQAASKESRADLIVVNMCSVRQSAVDRVYGLFPKFKKLKAQNSRLRQGYGGQVKPKTILTGCILEKDKQKFRERFDEIWGEKKYINIGLKNKNSSLAYVPISNGCNNFCAYCVVPSTRGRLICRNHKEILKEVKRLVKNGVKEIWLLGQNVNDYQSPSFLRSKSEESKLSSSAERSEAGDERSSATSFAIALESEGKDERSSATPTEPSGEEDLSSSSPSSPAFAGDSVINFAKLLKMIDDIPGDFKIIFTSPHPSNFSDELIDSLAKCQKFGQYLNLPVQSGDNKILKKMSRNYTVEEYKNLVKKIRKKIPTIKLSTDAIVGFPGETKSQFQKTVKLFKEIKFDWAYISKYSPRSGTAAFKLKDSIPLSEKKKREKILRKILKK